MFSWLLANVVLTVMALLFVVLNASAPHRLRFLVSFVALLAWLVPWHLVPEFLPRWYALDLWQLENQIRVNTAEYSLRPVVILTSGVASGAADILVFTRVQLGFIALCVTGLVLFFYHLCRHQMRLSHLLRDGRDGAELLRMRGLASPVPIFIQREITGAFSSGLLTPRIWVHEELAASTQLATLLHHELTHIRQHDNWYLLFITLVEKLLWWNPLVWLLGRRVRELQELSCDAVCQRASADYPLHLAELMIDNARLNPAQRNLLLSANIFNRTNLNIKRIKLLQRSYSMKPRHVFSILITAIGAVATIGIVTAQPEAGETGQLFVQGQAVPFPATGNGDAVFITRDTAQPLTEEEAAALGASRLFIRKTQSNGGSCGYEGATWYCDSGNAAPAELQDEIFVGPPGTPGIHLTEWNTGGPAEYIKINRNNGETTISLKFNDTPLPMILEPLANMVANEGMPAFGVAGEMILRKRADATGTATSDGEVVEFRRSSWSFPDGVEPCDVAIHCVGRYAPSYESLLTIEDESYKDKLVSVDAQNVSLEATLEIISAEANCNVFLEDDTIVVNSCAN